jgi:hypothetical protein
VANNLLAGTGLVSLLLPLLATILAGAAAISSAGGGPQFLPWALAGTLLFLSTIPLAPQPPYSGRLWRAAVYSDYSGKDPERRELSAVIASAATPGERRMAQRAATMYRLPPPP